MYETSISGNYKVKYYIEFFSDRKIKYLEM